MSIVCEKSELLGEDEEVREGERECVVEGKGSTKMPDGGGGGDGEMQVEVEGMRMEVVG